FSCGWIHRHNGTSGSEIGTSSSSCSGDHAELYLHKSALRGFAELPQRSSSAGPRQFPRPSTNDRQPAHTPILRPAVKTSRNRNSNRDFVENRRTVAAHGKPEKPRKDNTFFIFTKGHSGGSAVCGFRRGALYNRGSFPSPGHSFQKDRSPWRR